MRQGLFALCLSLPLVAAAQGQSPAPGEDFRRMCSTVTITPADGREMGRRAECLLAGVIPSTDRLGEARAQARAAVAAGEPTGGLVLYLAFQQDPAYQVLRNGKVDADAYRRLAARPVADRQEQVAAIEGLGLAAGKNNVAAGELLASYFHDTVAPGNVARLGALTSLLLRKGERTPALERMGREADAIEKNAAGTKASAHSFFSAYHDASKAAAAGFQSQSGGQSCAALELNSVSAGEIEGAEYLPLQGPLVAGSYLVRGHWSEFWTFRGCRQEVPVKVDFIADGWGGTSSRASYNKGS